MDFTEIPAAVFLAPPLLMMGLLGAAVGSLLNVCIYRIPYEKSIVWPSSRCGSCYRPVRWYDNIPLVSYWLLRGRCRHCGVRFSARYFLIELFVAVLFAALFYVEVITNPDGPKLFGQGAYFLAYGIVPAKGYVYFFYHALLLSFLIVTAFTDLDHMEIPLSVTLTGTVVGLIGSVLFPWPWPVNLAEAAAVLRPGVSGVPVIGLYPWPVWYPLPSWLPPGSPQLGLATGLAGVLAGAGVPRLIGFLFKAGRGKEGMGLGDSDLMMMVGAFLGWQVVLVAFFAAVPMALVIGVVQLFVRGDRPMPFGPALAAGSVVTWVGWRWLPREVQAFFFDPILMGGLLGVGSVLLFGISWLLGVIRGPDTPEPATPAESEPAPPPPAPSEPGEG